MNMGPVADGGSRSSFSNLSASAKPFTIDRTISSSKSLIPTSLNDDLCTKFHSLDSISMHNHVPEVVSGFTKEITSLSVHNLHLNRQSCWSGANQSCARDSVAPNSIRNCVNAPFACVDYSDSMRASVVDSGSQCSRCPKHSVNEFNNLAAGGSKCCYDLDSALDEVHHDEYSVGSSGDEQLCDRNQFYEGFVGADIVKRIESRGNCALTNELCLWGPQSYANYSSSENSAAEHQFNRQEITSISGRSSTDVNRNGNSINYVSNGRLPYTSSDQRLESVKSSLSNHASSSSELCRQIIFQKKSFPPVVIRPPVSISHPPALDSGLSKNQNIKSTDLISKSCSSFAVFENNVNDFNKGNGFLSRSTVYPHHSEGDDSVKINFSNINIRNTGPLPDYNSVNTHLQVQIPKGEADDSHCCSSSVTVDSPCWKGIPSSNLSPFYITKASESQLRIKESNDLNPHYFSETSQPDSHEGISSVKKFDDRYPIFNGNGFSSSSHLTEEPLISELKPAISGNGESQAHIQRKQIEFRKKESMENNSERKSEFSIHDIYKVIDGSVDTCENIPTSFTNVTRSLGQSDSEEVEINLSEGVLSSLKVSDGRPIDRSKKLSHKLQTHMIINTLKTLSELLLFQYSGGYDMMEDDFEAIQHTIDNLCLFKNENEFSIQQNISDRHQKGALVFDASDACWDTAKKEIMGRRKIERGDTGQDAMMYKYLWLEAEAALSYMGYRDRIAHLKQGRSEL